MNMMNNGMMDNNMMMLNNLNNMNINNMINMNNMNNMNNMMMLNNMNNNINMNNMNNMMMMNNMAMMNNAMNPMNNIMANNMMINNINNTMPINGQMMPQSGNLWNLLFQRKISRTNAQQNINILIDPDKLFIEAVSMFKLRIGSNEDFKFIFNGKDVIKDIKISQTGLQNNSIITVISLQDVEGAKYI